jgi:hypothetical protein
MPPKKHLSGAEKWKRERQEELFVQSQKGALHKFLSPSSSVVPHVTQYKKNHLLLNKKRNIRIKLMLQYRLNGLAMCTIEKDILDTLDLNAVLDDFASRNARRKIFS